MSVREYVIVLLVINSLLVSCEVCKNKSEVQCTCRHLVDDKTHVPVYIADCSGQSIDRIPARIENDINFLDFSLNNLEELNTKQQPINSTSLQNLILRLNKIKKIDEDFFDNIKNLKELDLSHNSLAIFNNSGIFNNIKNLTRLDLSFNEIVRLPSGIFSPMVNIQYLDLSYNPLDFLQYGSTLSDGLGVSSNLKHLNLNGLNITYLKSSFFDNFKYLKSLSLADNAFTIIPTIPFSVEKLDLSGNQLTYISARYLNYQSLKVLKLNRMPNLTSIHHYAFYNLISLEKLYLSDCPNLKEFSELAFDLLFNNVRLNPSFISLANNGLSSLNESYKFLFKKIQHVDLRHNPWRCDCDILWLQEFESVLNKPEQIRCNSPIDLKNKKILELSESDLIECHPAIYGKKSHRILIVLLSCFIVILCGLIFVLLRYPIDCFRNNRFVGPTSPYNLASTSEYM